MATKKTPRSGKAAARPEPKKALDGRADHEPCPVSRPLVVGIGASAGGIEAVSQLLRLLPVDTGMSFVVLQHMDPRRPSQLCEVLAQSTRMTVVEARNGVHPVASHVYVMPPGTELALRDRQFVVSPTDPDRHTHRSVDLFLRSLAEEEKNCAIGVVMSGTGSDGTDGLRAIRAAGGIALVEDPATARFAPMPQSAVTAGAVDRVLSIQGLAEELVALSQTPYLMSVDASVPGTGADQDELIGQVLGLVRGHSGSDFSEYKSTTFRRRLARRMVIRRTDTLDQYLRLLRAEAAEIEALCRDILIHVTEFFRDPQAFEALREQVIPKILERRHKGDAIRIWVPGCATGEEPYSIAITLLEALAEQSTEATVQIFATDLSAEMIDRARAAIYPQSAVERLGRERLERFFTPVDGGYRVTKAVRNLCVFVKHDLTRDPPFARLDLISCRNVLIYFGAALQKRVFPLFHHCLGPGGFLLLGQAEAIPIGGLFAPVDKVHKLYAKIGASRPLAVPLGRNPHIDGPTAIGELPAADRVPPDVERQADNLILSRYAPAGALVDERMDIITLRGRTSPFLELRAGHPDLNLLKLARDGLVPALRSAFQKASRDMVTVRQEGVTVIHGDQALLVDIEVAPVTGVPDKGGRYFLVLFHVVAKQPPKATATANKRTAKGRGKAKATAGRALSHQREVDRLREEAEATRAFLQSVLDERQRMNDEVTGTNEELVASNEEMQSTNEELEAAKEELQSANEELTTLNDELQLRNQQLGEVNSDLVNILATVDMPIIIVSGDRRVRRFNPSAKAMMNLIPSDLGRPIHDIRLNIVVEDLDALLTEVIETLAVKQLDVKDREGRWFRLQIRPYRTVDNRLDGVVLSLTDIDIFKQAVGTATVALDRVNAILETIRVPVVVLDDALRVRSVNAAYCTAYPGDAAEMIGESWSQTSDGLWNQPTVTSALERLLSRGGDMAVDVELRFSDSSKRTVILAGSVLQWASETPQLLLTPIDVTDHAILLESANAARVEAERANKAKDLFLAMLSHELRAPLHTITLHADLLLAGAATDPVRAKRAADAIVRAASSQDQIISDLLDVSAIVAGKVTLVRRPLDLGSVVTSALDAVRDRATAKQIDLHCEAAGSTWVLGDPTRMQQIVGNLLTNAIKFTPAGGRVTIATTHDGEVARVTVRDTGQGIDPEFLPHIFDRFAQADTSNARIHGGLGLGLAIVRDLARLHRGTVVAESEGAGKGASFTVELPLLSAHAITVVEEETSPWGHDIRALSAALDSQDRDQLRGLKVLVVDDDEGARTVLSDILTFQGAEVRTVDRASDAMAALSDFQPDVLLCDIAMPDEDGYSLIRRVRALAPTEGGRIPAIAVTALATRNDRQRALEAGFQLHVAKPTKFAVVCAAVRKVYDEAPARKAGPPSDAN